MDLDLGSHVKSSDGKEVGRVDRIIYQPDTMKVREFVVHKGFFLRNDRIVSIHHVDRIDDDHTVHLKLPAEKTRDLPAFVVGEHVPVYSGDLGVVSQPNYIVARQSSVPTDAVVLTHGSDVYDSDGKHIGHLDEVRYDEDGCAREFVVDSGVVFTHDVRVPMTEVSRVTHDRIDLGLAARECQRAVR